MFAGIGKRKKPGMGKEEELLKAVKAKDVKKIQVSQSGTLSKARQHFGTSNNYW